MPQKKTFKKPRILENLEQVAQILPVPIYWLDVNSVVLGGNDLFFKAIGASPKDLGKTAYDVYPKEIAERIIRHNEEVMEKNEILSQEEPIEDITTGQTKYFAAVKAPLHDDEGNVIGLVGTSIDITAKKKQEELEKQKIVLDEKIKVLQLMGGAVAHELRTPLAAIRLAAQSIERILPKLFQAYHAALDNKLIKPITHEVQFRIIETVFKNIQEEVNASNTFIDNMLLNIQNLAADPKDMEILSMKKCVEDSISRFPFDEKAEKFTKVDVEYDFFFRGMPILMQHVIFNLLRNSIYYVLESTKDGAGITIWTQHGEDDWNELHFKDTGTGISEEHMKHVFERFFSKRYHGTGVGLAFCKQVITQFGGTITCDSKEGEYTHFTMRFPPVDEKKELIQG
jgi:PAS domain S-box-containing protein